MFIYTKNDFEKDLDNLKKEIPFNKNIVLEEYAPKETEIILFRIKSLTYEKDFPRLEAFENVIASINTAECRLIYYLKGTGNDVELYLGVAWDKKQDAKYEIENYASMLEKAFKGNFLGTEIVPCKDTDKIRQALQKESVKYSTILGIPTANKDKEKISFQGIDRLINMMDQGIFHLIIIWEAISKNALRNFDIQVKNLHEKFQAFGKQVHDKSSYDRGDTKKLDDSYFKNDTSTPKTTSTISKSSNKEINEQEVLSQSNGKNISTILTTEKGNNTLTTSKYEVSNRTIQEYLEYIDKELLPRLHLAKAKGMYNTAIYLGAQSSLELNLLENAVTSIFQGDIPTFFPLCVAGFSHKKTNSKEHNAFTLNKLVADFSIYKNLEASADFSPLLSRPIERYKTNLATCLTPSEISIIAGLPQKEVAGIELREQVAFGLNLPKEEEKTPFKLGCMYHEGNKLESRQVSLMREDLDKHIFIAGTTGSGKTTTCHRLLQEADMPFMVIEPAKTEYRILLKDSKFSDIQLFTIGSESKVPFRLNPFEFLETESLASHVDLLKACFMASFDMEAAIPNLLEEALYKAYEAFGWSFRDNSNKFLEKRELAWDCGGLYFPTISDYIDIIKSVVESKGFGERLSAEYLGSILGRLDSLRTGIKGIMFDTRLSVDFNALIENKVILELEELKASEDKAFMIGLLLGRLSETLKSKHKKNPNFRHITLVEEAHRLLSKANHTTSQTKMLGIEMFTDMLAEIRKYGESLIIVDQIPSKLASEVLKNTNTKIIHKLFSHDDKTVIGDAMALDEKQRNYLSYLNTGEAIVFSQGWKKPVDTHVEMPYNFSTSQEISEEVVYLQGWKYWLANPHIYSPLCYTLQKNTSFVFTESNLREIDKLTQDCYSLEKYTQGDMRFQKWLEIKANARNLLNKNANTFLGYFFYSLYMNKNLPKEAFSLAGSELNNTENQNVIKEKIKEILKAENAKLFNKIFTRTLINQSSI